MGLWAMTGTAKISNLKSYFSLWNCAQRPGGQKQYIENQISSLLWTNCGQRPGEQKQEIEKNLIFRNGIVAQMTGRAKIIENQIFRRSQADGVAKIGNRKSNFS